MAEIELSNSMVVLLDDDDLELVLQYKWSPLNDGHNIYAIGYPITDTKKRVSMHRLIMDFPQGMEIDHINNNCLDNRRSNLRIVTRSQNMMNQRTQKVAKTSKYRGVCRNGNNWQAEGKLNQKRYYLGTFKTQEEAARAYDIWAIEAFGEYAKPNFPVENAC